MLRPWRPWSPSVLALLRHLEAAGFEGAPRVVGTGQSADGREAVAYVPGDVAPLLWAADAAYALGALLRALHAATASFAGAGPWLPRWGRDLPGSARVIGHCDAAPWNVVARDGVPVALVDWDTAGPVGARWEVAQAAWLNARLFDDDVALRDGLPDPATRAGCVAAICDGYGLAGAERAGLVDAMVEVAVRSAAQEAIDAAGGGLDRLGGGTPLGEADLLRSMTWRTRSAAWMLRHRATLDRALR